MSLLHIIRGTILTPLMTLVLLAQGAAQPAPEHARLKQFEGNWKALVRIGDNVSEATSVHRLGMGGMWLISDFTGDLGGVKFEGQGIDGYDQDRMKYVSVWVDSMSSTLVNFEGTYDRGSNTLTMKGEGKRPDGQPLKYKSKSRFVDEDHHIVEMYIVGPGGSDQLMMTVEYTRKE